MMLGVKGGPIARVSTACGSPGQRVGCKLAAHFMLVLSMLATMSLTAPRARSAEHRGPDELQAILDRRGDLMLRKTDLTDALFTIGQEWGVSLVMGQRVEGEVHCDFRNAPLRDVLNAILLSNGYGYQVQGQSLVILSLEELGDVNPLFETATISVRHADPTALAAAVQVLNSPRGKVQAIPAAGSLLVIDFADRVARIEQLVRLLDANAQGVGGAPQQAADLLQVTYLDPQFVSPPMLKDAITAVLSAEGKVAVLEKDKRVVVSDYPYNLRLAREVLQRIDFPRPQLRITAYIYDVSLEDMETLGINWSHGLEDRFNADGDARSFWAIESLTRVPFDASATGAAMTFVNMSRHFDLNTAIVALSNAKDSRLLADPNIVVMENEPAMISIISEIPFQQLTQTAQGGNIGTTAFREAGVKLEVTPRIDGDGMIQLDVTPEFSRLTGFTPEDNQPIIDRRIAQTTVRVANGHTLVIGGLRTRSDLGDFDGIPFLKDLPGVGVLFRGRETTVRESELVVFLRPEIVTPVQPHHLREQAAIGTSRQFLGQIPIGDAGCEVAPEVLVPAEPIEGEGGPSMSLPAPAASRKRDGQSTPARLTRLPAVDTHKPRASATRRTPAPSMRFTQGQSTPGNVRSLPPVDEEVESPRRRVAARDGSSSTAVRKLPPTAPANTGKPSSPRPADWLERVFRF